MAQVPVEFESWLRESYPDGIIVAMPEGRYALIHRLLFHWTLIVGTNHDCFGYDDRWCYQTESKAVDALREWRDAEFRGEPQGWHRHPKTGRRRVGGDVSKEYVDE